MNELELNWVINRMPPSDDRYLEIMSIENVEKARRFHMSFPQYSVTAMANLSKMAGFLGLGGVYVKDERFRFGLNAFKVLGASFAMGRYIAHEMGEHVTDISYDDLTSPELKDTFGTATFFTATDGNHGRGVAWAARRLHQKAVVHMPKGSAKSRFDNIAKEKATVTIEDMNYDDCVRLAAKEAAQTEHGVVIQDTAWEGYEDIPSWIMQGYGTISHEAAEQLRELEVNRPTHIFIQAGVGSFASSVVGYFTNLFPDHRSWMGHSQESCGRIYRCRRLGGRKGHAHARGSGAGRSACDLRRIRRGDHGMSGADYDERRPVGDQGASGPWQRFEGPPVFHGGQYRSRLLPQGRMGRCLRNRK